MLGQELPEALRDRSGACVAAPGHHDVQAASFEVLALVDDASSGRCAAKPAHIFRFDDVQAAHRLLDSQKALGKIVVVVD